MELEPLAVALRAGVVDVIVERVTQRVAARWSYDVEPWAGVSEVAAHLCCKPQRIYDLSAVGRPAPSLIARKARACCLACRRSTAGSTAVASHDRRDSCAPATTVSARLGQLPEFLAHTGLGRAVSTGLNWVTLHTFRHTCASPLFAPAEHVQKQESQAGAGMARPPLSGL